ncbi:uncharacterized protein clnk isoform 1-T2 [Pholidichthys leucotaenia]
MDRNRADRKRTQRWSDNTEDHEYHVVDDQEERMNVRILPARPLNDEREYADRNLPRSSSTQCLSSVSSGDSNMLPQCLPRERETTAPAVHRNLKPGRQKIKSDRKVPPPDPTEQHSVRHSPSQAPFALELINVLSELAVESGRNRQQGAVKKTEVRSHTNEPRNTESPHAKNASQRHSWDLESQIEMRSPQCPEMVPSRRHHHEWPQTKEDLDQHDFIPVEKPQQAYWEEDWYVGACNRADAEHALHLVNKDGAFLVRDCSINTNNEPLVLVVYHEKKVYNIKIRFIESTSKYVLGTGYRSTDMFNSVADIIKFHSIFPIILISGRNVPGSKYPDNCVLTCPVTKRDVDYLLQ